MKSVSLAVVSLIFLILLFQTNKVKGEDNKQVKFKNKILDKDNITNEVVLKDKKRSYSSGSGSYRWGWGSGGGGGGGGGSGGGGGGGSGGGGGGGGGGGRGGGWGWGGGGGGRGWYKWGCSRRGRGRRGGGGGRGEYVKKEYAMCLGEDKCKGKRLECPQHCGGFCFYDCLFLCKPHCLR